MKSAISKPKGTEPLFWEPTSVQCLLRNKESRKYYGRFTIRGKQKWVSLDTDVFTIAKLRLGDEKAKIEKQRGTEIQVAAGKATMGDLMEVYLERTKNNSDFKPSTVISRETAAKKISKTWKGFENLEPRQVTPAAILDWVTRFKRDGTQFTPPRAKAPRKGNSATSVNRAVDTLRRMMDIAIEHGQIHSNPVLVKPSEGRLKKKVVKKRIYPPSNTVLQEFFTTIENNGSACGWGQEAADLCRFLFYSGARIGEVSRSKWGGVNWERKTLFLPGTKTDAAPRYIPLFPALEALLKRISERRKSAARFKPDQNPGLAIDDSIFHIQECQGSINTACAKMGMERLTHHDLRHYFATTCLESGVDVGTVSAWMGHSDGGALVLSTYGHLRPAHSQESAQKVKFGIE